MNKVNNSSQNTRRRINPVVLVVCVTLAAVLLTLLILGTVMLVRDSRAYVKYRGVTVDGEVAAYLAAEYKERHIYLLKKVHGVTDAKDTVEFWSRLDPEGVSYGEGLKKATEEHIREVVVCSYLFDRYSRLTSEDKEYIEGSVDTLLSINRCNDEDEFNALVSEYGFSYDSLIKASEMVYKANRLKSVITGENGEVLAGSQYYGDCNRYYSTFSYVYLLFIRTEWEYAFDSEGEPVRDDMGNLVTRTLTSEEKQERAADIETIRAAIDAFNTEGDRQMNREWFESFLEKYNYDDYTMDGYYLSEKSEYTVGLASDVSEELVTVALGLDVGHFGEVDTEYGTCFIMRNEAKEYAYLDTECDVFFTDFYSDAADYVYSSAVSELVAEVTFTDRYASLDIIALPYNYRFVAIPYIYRS